MGPIPFRYDASSSFALIRCCATGTIAKVSLSQIRYFVAVAEEGNVGRAARRLHVAQPPVTRQVRALEDEIGRQLFQRTPRGMTLLPAGRVFFDHARVILAAVDRALLATRVETQEAVGPRVLSVSP